MTIESIHLNRYTIKFTAEFSFVTSGFDDYYHVFVSINWTSHFLAWLVLNIT